MRKFNPLILLCLLIVTISGCASSENSIISMSLDGAVITEAPVIDETTRTIFVTVEPVDLSTITPTFELSANAEIGTLTLEDGQPCTCTVIAADGTASEWTITVTVEPGISFISDEIRKTFRGGVVDSADSINNEAYGNGVPSLSVCTTGQSGDMGLGFSEYYDLASDENNEVEILSLNLTNSSEQLISGFHWIVSSTSGFNGTINVEKTHTGDIGDWVIGTFFGSANGYVDGEMSGDIIRIDDGFFKLLRIADDSGTAYLF
jgi:hypothetical protein